MKTLPLLGDSPSEIEISNLLNHEDMLIVGANILRRLVFQRDCLLEKVDVLQNAIKNHQQIVVNDADYLGEKLRGSDERLYKILSDNES